MKIGAIGAFLELADESIFIHRRSYQATHVAGFLDSSCAGFVHNENGVMNLEKWLMKKINDELGLEKEEIEILGVNSVHIKRSRF